MPLKQDWYAIKTKELIQNIAGFVSCLIGFI